MIGLQMEDNDLHLITLELRFLMGMMAKISREALQQRLIAKQIELSGLQVGILHVLGHLGNQTLSELSKKFMLDPSTLVPTVDTLERKNFVVRQRDPNDRRRVPISLTEEGTALLDELTVVDDTDPVMMGLSKMQPDEVVQLLTLTRNMIGNMGDGDELLSSVNERMAAYCNRNEIPEKPAE